MHFARWVLIPILLVALVFIYHPLARAEAGQFWEQARPQVLQLMDGLYLAIRNFVAEGDMQDGIEDHSPGVDYDRIITRDRSSSF